MAMIKSSGRRWVAATSTDVVDASLSNLSLVPFLALSFPLLPPFLLLSCPGL
jgi:hypothetical protein